ncbi:hypothetical protein M413DRAFT_438503 [Hebeloma cylindrosporum]|uniref:Uncharacterized protein n=1 Tax=Hebeloma cylindrosporum TaxID=76867 RepID=A0A0C3CKU5_HEBCY|nr:hypothetical protein M413DRAFT_438503 [Hebeloma cylindrosporum h7]
MLAFISPPREVVVQCSCDSVYKRSLINNLIDSLFATVISIFTLVDAACNVPPLGLATG